jgi:3-methylcrotonyl-CoA carboxylase alpha subunit
VVEGDTVTIFYDPMIAKLIVFDATRAQALQRLREALADCEVVGPKSNVGFLERLARHPAVVDGIIDTGYLDRHLDEFLTGELAPADRVLFAAATAALLDDEHAAVDAAAGTADPHSPWNRADAWRVGHAGKRIIALSLREQRHEIEARGHDGNYQLRHGDATCEVQGARHDGNDLSARFDGEARCVPARADARHVLLHDADGQRYSFSRAAAFAWEVKDAAGGNQVIAPMPGRIVLVKAKAGDSVEQGQELLVMEAMKMELALKAPRAGTIESINAVEGEFVEADTVLARFAG